MVALVFGQEEAQGCCAIMLFIIIFGIYGFADFLGSIF